MRSKYRYPKLEKAMSYEKYLERKIEEARLRGANLEVKTYSKRIPKNIKDLYAGADAVYLRFIDSLIVTIQSGGKIIAHGLFETAFFRSTIKVSNREGTDDMIESANRNFLYPITEQINER
jgi:hypothetical protein